MRGVSVRKNSIMCVIEAIIMVSAAEGKRLGTGMKGTIWLAENKGGKKSGGTIECSN